MTAYFLPFLSVAHHPHLQFFAVVMTFFVCAGKKSEPLTLTVGITKVSISCGQRAGSVHLSSRVRPQRGFAKGQALLFFDQLSRVLTRRQLLVAAFPPYFLCNMFVKHAWLTFYYGLSRTRAQRWFIHAMQVIAAAFGISSVLVILLQCIPLHAVWRHTLEPPNEQSDARCIDLMTFFYFNSAFMIVNDVIMYLIPIFLLRKVESIRDHRWSLSALFGICFL